MIRTCCFLRRSYRHQPATGGRKSVTPSPRPYEGLVEELHYSFHDRTITVTSCGRICFNGRKINLSGVFAGQNVGIKQIAEKVWLVSFMQYDLRFFDDESIRVECAPNLFEVKVSSV